MANKITKKATKTLKKLTKPRVAMVKGRCVTVKNADDAADTTATILVQNKIKYTPKVSIIIPVYNVEEYLCECLDSVINQTLKEIEIICVDDGSTDSSLKILQAYAKKDNRITVMSQQNLHAGVARNAGLAVARGEYVHFLDSDDWVDLDTYEKLYKIIKNQNANFAKFKSYTYDTKSNKIIPSEYTDMSYIEKDMTISIDEDAKLAIRISDSPWSGIYKLKFICENNIRFDDFICSNDVGFYFRCLVNSRSVYFINDKFVYYRVNNQKSLVGIRPRNFDCQIKTYYNIQNIVKNESALTVALVQERFSMAIFWRFKAYMEDKNIDDNTKETIRCLTTKFFADNPTSKYKGDYDKYIADNSGKYSTKVSVIIPVYNTDKYISQCLDSIINQTLKDIEIICVDDGSTDRSLDIINKYKAKDSRVKLYQQQHKRAGAARNFGARMAQGKYIYFIDSDDWIDLDCLEKLYNKIETTHTDICIYGLNKYDERTSQKISDSYFDTSMYKSRDKTVCTYKDIKSAIFARFGAFFEIYNKEFFIKNDLFFSETIVIGEDVLPHVKSIVLAKNISFLNENLYYYRINRQGSVMKSSKQDANILDIFVYVDKVEQFLRKVELYDELEDQFIEFVFEQSLFHFGRMENNDYKDVFIQKALAYIQHLNIVKIRKSVFANKFFQKINKDTSALSPCVSVIIPVYNVERYLRQCLDSVINQTLKEIEIICVNDGSPDNSLAILNEYATKDKRIIVINQENQGLSCSRNNAMQIAKGEYIVFVDSDDYLRADALEIIYTNMATKQLDMLSYNGVNFDNETNAEQINPYWEFRYLPKGFDYTRFNFKSARSFLTSMAVSSCLTAYRRTLLEQNDIVFPEHVCFEDNLFFVKAILNANTCGIIKDKLYYRRIHDAAITQNWNKHFADYLTIADLVIDYVKNKQPDLYGAYTNAYLNNCVSVWSKFDNHSKRKYIKALRKLARKYKFKNALIKKEIPLFFTCILFPYYLLKLPILRRRYYKAQIRKLKSSLMTWRVDIKNFGGPDNNQLITSHKANINQPMWLTNSHGKGTVVSSSAMAQKITIRAVKSGVLRFDFRGADKRDSHGVRLPIWIDYKSIKIDGKVIALMPIATWHDKPYYYEMPVNDGQTITVEIQQQSHRYAPEELKKLIPMLEPSSDYIKSNLNKIIKTICRHTGHRPSFGHFLCHKQETNYGTKLYICGLPVWRTKANIYTYMETRLQQLALAQSKQLQVFMQQMQSVVNATNKEFGDKLNNQAAQLNSLESLQIGQSQVMRAKMAGLEQDLQNYINSAIARVNTAVEDANADLCDRFNNQLARLNNLESLQIGQHHLVQSTINDVATNLQNYFETQIALVTNIVETKNKELDTQLNNFKSSQIEQFEGVKLEMADINTKMVNMIADQIKTGLVKLEDQNRALLQNNLEPYWANVYHDTISASSWLQNKSVSPGRWAVSYIVLYVLYRILDEIKPKAILECGLGQSSKLTIQYADSHNAELMICENNPEWLSFFQRQFPTADRYTKILDTEMINVVPKYESRTYKGFKQVIENTKFNLVLIDGPLGSAHYSRPEILDIVDNLDKSFVILLDDMNRVGEQEIWTMLKLKLQERGIKFQETIYKSDKHLGLLCSPDWGYLTSL